MRPQSPALAGLVSSLGLVGEVLPPGRERVLPYSELTLMVNLHEDEFRTYERTEGGPVRRTLGAVLAGPRAEHIVIDTEEQRSLVEVVFELGGAAPFVPFPLSELSGELVELGELWGRDGAVLRERVLEAATPVKKLRIVEEALLAHVAAPLEPDPLVTFAAGALERGSTVSEVTSRVGMTPKRFVRRFRARVGLTPKRYSRVRRLQRVLAEVVRAEEVSWGRLAAEHGFSDQAHLINEFRALAGVTPTAYRARSAHARNHVPVTAGA